MLLRGREFVSYVCRKQVLTQAPVWRLMEVLRHTAQFGEYSVRMERNVYPGSYCMGGVRHIPWPKLWTSVRSTCILTRSRAAPQSGAAGAAEVSPCSRGRSRVARGRTPCLLTSSALAISLVLEPALSRIDKGTPFQIWVV